MLPEWAQQRGLLLTWPHAQGTWHSHLEAAEACFTDIARYASVRVTVLVACLDAAHRESIRVRLQAAQVDMQAVRLYIAASDDSWARDHGPITVAAGDGHQLLDFRFNGWGGKYPAAQDDALTTELWRQGAFGDTPLHHPPLVVEGGALETEGQGTLLATRRSLLTETRNPGLAQTEIEAVLNRLLGIQRFAWLEHGWLAGDDTDGHIDMLARFCDAATIAHITCNDPADAHDAPLQAMQQELQSLTRHDGKPYRLIGLPLPAPQFDTAGGRLPLSYANFLILNDAVLVPGYGDPLDHEVLDRLRAGFPGHTLISVDCRALAQQYGSLHCATLQLPAALP